MTGWLILATYAVGWLLTAWTVAVRMTDAAARTELGHRQEWRARFNEPHRADGKPLVDGEERILNVAMGAMIGSIWPLAVLVMVVARKLRSPIEVAEADRVELEALRKLARKHGLPMPEAKP